MFHSIRGRVIPVSAQHIRLSTRYGIDWLVSCSAHAIAYWQRQTEGGTMSTGTLGSDGVNGGGTPASTPGGANGVVDRAATNGGGATASTASSASIPAGGARGAARSTTANGSGAPTSTPGGGTRGAARSTAVNGGAHDNAAVVADGGMPASTASAALTSVGGARGAAENSTAVNDGGAQPAAVTAASGAFGSTAVNGGGHGTHAALTNSVHTTDTHEHTVYIHVRPREDCIQLYGYYSELEKELFLSLIKVNGIGPAAALNILSAMDVGAVQRAITDGDHALFSQVPKIGTKSAQKIILSLRGNIAFAPAAEQQQQSAVVDSLISMGYEHASVLEIVTRIKNEVGESDFPSRAAYEEYLFKQALQQLA